MKSISSSRPANSLFRNDPLFRNDQATRRTERAILRPISHKSFGISDEEGVFVFKYYRDTVAGPPSSGERLMLVSFEDLQELRASHLQTLWMLGRCPPWSCLMNLWKAMLWSGR